MLIKITRADRLPQSNANFEYAASLKRPFEFSAVGVKNTISPSSIIKGDRKAENITL